eukprot:Plantae.Rhodophyta-Rhodochaete_pulchella.ctg14118.p1 GENE.Plantae.Rhodophyta-Rhodochaete_pulchella.ctg14118~~Plantae.Rhodophyta-Rhodochaete_pulchella.ctg14118.p1  ORF type:complete len:179 (+),score=16.46 Plantae.Rhodophyta-Rhodochaete_pulchella.ctg14118:2439-2975(+)
MKTQAVPEESIPRKNWPPGVLSEPENFGRLWLARPLRQNTQHAVDPEATYYVTHTSFTLNSVWEMPAFFSDSDKIFASLNQDVPGYVAQSALIAPLHRTLDTLTIWTSEQAEADWIRGEAVHKQALNDFYGRKRFHRSPRHKIEKFQLRGRDLPKDYGDQVGFWRKVNHMKFQSGPQE